MKKVFIRFFTVFLVLTIVLTGVAFSFSAESDTITVQLDSSVTAYGWNQIVNAINFNDYDSDEDGWKQTAEATNLRSVLLYCLVDCEWNPGSKFYNKILYTFPVCNIIDAGISWAGERPNSDVRFCDYFQNTFGYAAFALRGGKQRAVDLWNAYCPDQPVSLNGDYSYTYAKNTKYTKESFENALACLKAYIVYAQDNMVCSIDTSRSDTSWKGRWTRQKARYAALEDSLKALKIGTSVVTTTTKTLDQADNYGFMGYLNVINVIPDSDNTGLRSDGTPYKNFLNTLITIIGEPSPGGSDAPASYMNSYAMSDGTLLKDYVQDIYGSYAYVLRGGRRKAVDYWNSKLFVELALDGNSYTYTDANAQDLYPESSYQAAVDALNVYMENTSDGSCFDVENGGGRYYDQKAKYDAFVSAVNACAATETQTLVDFSGVTSSDDTLNLLITFYNNVDVVSIKADADVQKWAKTLKEGVAAGKRSNEIFVGATDVVTCWETLIRYTVKLNAGAKSAADAVMTDGSLWPLGTPIYETNQVVYDSSQFNEVYNLWIKIRDEYRRSTTVKTSEVISACNQLKEKIRTLKKASLPFTKEQLDAKDVLATYVPYYRARINSVVLPENKATENYKQYLAWVEEAESYLSLDWVDGTSKFYPSVETMHGLVLPEAAGGKLEDHYYDYIRFAFGLDVRGYDKLVKDYYNTWVNSGLYTEDSLSAVKTMIDNYEIASESGARANDNTDEMVRNDILTLKSFLVEKPIVEPELKLAIKGANISLQKSLAIYFAIDSACIEQYTDLYAEFIRNGITTTSYEIIDAFSQDIVAFKFSDIAACEAGDDITVVIHGLHDGREYKSEPFVYSVKTYCYNMLSKSSVSDGMKRICVDLLDYCAASQTYFKYQMEALVNSDLTAEQRAFGSDSYEELSDRSENAGSESDEYKISGFNLVYEDVIKAMVAIKAPNTDGLAVKVTFGDSVYTCKDFFDLSINDEDYYVFYFTEILPNKFRQTFTITFEVNGVVVGGAGTYSVESYLARRLPKTTDVNYRTLLEATAKYGDACAAFFGK